LKQPLLQLRLILQNAADLEKLEAVKMYLQDQVKVKEVILSTDVSSVRSKLVPNQKSLGQKLRGDRKKVVDVLEKLSHEEVRGFVEKKEIVIHGYTLTSEDASVQYIFQGDGSNLIAEANSDMVVVLNTLITEELKEEFFVNQIVNYVQKLRKSSGVRKGDDIEIFYSPMGKKLDTFLLKMQPAVQLVTKRPFLHISNRPLWIRPLGIDVAVIDGVKIEFSVSPAYWCAHVPHAHQDSRNAIDFYLGIRNRTHLFEDIKQNKGELHVVVDGVVYHLKQGESLFPSASLRAASVSV